MARFVIQQHDATRMHYDFRLQIGRVFKSWAVPKGLSTNPTVKRLAVATPDHPLSWGSFEGVIPEGEYGAGPVLLWDRGTFRNIRTDAKGKLIPLSRCYKEGHLLVWLDGEKMRGGYAIIRFGKTGNQWLVIKQRDTEASARRNPVRTQTKSVKSGKTIRQLRA
jgi:DNA ligase D-like protein (predicted 3'-phosphoesterase)